METLQTAVVLALQYRNDFDELYFQHDVTPPYFARNVRNKIDEVFPDKWIRRRGSKRTPKEAQKYR